jgi:glycosyltransferase involved in cell wall biosynthesis
VVEYSKVPIVSVVIPTYGHAKYILQTIDSVFSQTYRDYEVIVINDGSPDNTEEILQDLINCNSIQYVKQSNQGVAAARNNGISIAKGKYIALLDDDDIWPEDKLAWQVGMMSEDTTVVGGISMSFGKNSFAEEGKETDEVKVINFFDLFDGNPFISPGQVLVSRSALREVGGFDSNIWGSDDYDMWMKLAKIGPLLRRSKVALHYRVHETNTSHDHSRMILSSHEVVNKHLNGIVGVDLMNCRRRAYQWMYSYLGKSLLRSSIKNILKIRGNVCSNIYNILLFLKIFGLVSLLDNNILLYILKNIFAHSSCHRN